MTVPGSVLAAVLLAASAAAVLATPALAQPAGGGAEAGQLVFNNACRTCHSMKDGDNRLGPHLHAIIGRKAGSVENFAYSESMKQAGLVWDEATLDRFLAEPDAVVRDNKMKPFGGMPSAEERAKLIAYLKSAGS